MNDIEIFKKYIDICSFREGLYVQYIDISKTGSLHLSAEDRDIKEVVIFDIKSCGIEDIVGCCSKELILVYVLEYNTSPSRYDRYDNHLLRMSNILINSQGSCVKNRYFTCEDYELFRGKYKLVDKLSR
jgi:hypothetical protein